MTGSYLSALVIPVLRLSGTRMRGTPPKYRNMFTCAFSQLSWSWPEKASTYAYRLLESTPTNTGASIRSPVSGSSQRAFCPAQSTSALSPGLRTSLMVASALCAYFWQHRQNWEYMRGMSPFVRHFSQYSCHRSVSVTPLLPISLWMYSQSGLVRENGAGTPG